MYLDPKSTAQFRDNGTARSTQAAQKRHFHFLLLPGANMLDFTAAIEPLRVANTLTREPAYSWSIVSENGGPVACSNGITLPVDSGLLTTHSSVCVVVCSGGSGYLDAAAPTLQWLRRHARFGGSVAAIATGAFTLARAGLAKSSQLTLHWSLIPVFEEIFPDLKCANSRTISGDALSYSAGGSSSLDLTLSVIQADFDAATAQRVAEFCLHDFNSNADHTQRLPISKRVGSRHTAIMSIVKKMEQSIQVPVSLDELISNENISKRQVERLFKRDLGTSPSQYFRNLRLDRARSLLQATDMSVLEIAIATGFSCAATFSRPYRKRFGERPAIDRKATAAPTAVPVS